MEIIGAIIFFKEESLLKLIPLFIILLLIWILVAGLIKPRLGLPWLKEPTRVKVIFTFLVCFSVFVIIGVQFLDEDTSKTVTKASNHKEAEVTQDKQLARKSEQATATQQESERNRHVVEIAISSLQMRPGWGLIKVDTANKREYSLTLNYTKPPNSMLDVAVDTKTIARAVLSELVKEGRKPASEFINVFVWAQLPGIKGETGVDLVRVYGSSSYDYNRDQLDFEPYKP